MLDLFRDSPFFDWVAETVSEENERRLQEERQHALELFRQTVVALVAQRFPELEHLARKQVDAVEDKERLQRAILQISTTQDLATMVRLLSALDENEKNEE